MTRTTLVALCAALTACSNHTSSTVAPPPLPSATNSATGVAMSVTIYRSLPASSALRAPKQIPSNTASIDMRVYSGGAHGAPVNSTCSAFTSAMSSVTLSMSVPQGHDTLVITAYDGGCNGASGSVGSLGTGNALTTFQGSGTVSSTSTSVNAVFSGNNPIILSPIIALPRSVPVTASWNSMGPTNYSWAYRQPASGKLQAFAINQSNSSTFYIGGGWGDGDEVATQFGVYKTTDFGSSYVSANTGLTDRIVNALWLNQSSPTTLLAGTQIGGIFRTTDGANTWTNVNTSPGVTSFAVSGGTIYASTQSGVLASNDAGATWTAQTSGTVMNAVAAGGGMIYAGGSDGSIWSSSGGSWQKVGSVPTTLGFGRVDHIAVDQLTPATLYAGVSAINSAGIFTDVLFGSSDGGSTWHGITVPLSGRGSQVLAMSLANPHTLYVGGTSLYSTSDGQTLNPIGAFGDSRGLYVFGGGANDIVFGLGDQGLYYSVDGGKTYTGLSGSLSNNVMNDVSVNGTTIMTAIQDYAPIISHDGGRSWSTTFIGIEDGTALINPGNPRYCYLFDYTGYNFSSDGCQTFVSTPSLAPIAEFGLYDNVAVDLQAPNYVYIATPSGVYRSNDFGTTFTFVNWSIPVSGKVANIVVDPSNSNNIYVSTVGSTGGSNPTNLFISKDAGNTWQASGLLSYSAPSITVHPTNGQIVLAAIPSYSGGSANTAVFRSTNGGLTFSQTANAPAPTFAAPIPPGLQSLRHRGDDDVSPFTPPYLIYSSPMRIRFNPASSTPYVALTTTRGVFVSTDYGDTWSDITSNALTTAFAGMQWYNGYLYLASDGQGVLRSQSPLQ